MIFNIDREILIWIQENFRNELMTPVWKFITTLGDKGMIWIFITIILLSTKKYRKVGMMSTISLIMSLIVCNLMLKNLVCRTRPYDSIQELMFIGRRMTDYSFPSGHTSTAFSSAVIVLKKLPKKIGVPIYVFAYFVAFSRLYLGVHYLTDVIAGAIVGTLIAVIVMLGFDNYKKIIIKSNK